MENEEVLTPAPIEEALDLVEEVVCDCDVAEEATEEVI